MKTEWSNIGTGMQETRGITDADVQSQATAEAAMRNSLNRELNASEKARATRIVTDVRKANGEAADSFVRAYDAASRSARGPVRDLATLRDDLANRLKEITC
jgi:hypothetical protein